MDVETVTAEIRTLVDPESGVVSLGFLHSFGGWLIPTLMDRYRAKAPNTTFELEGGPANTIVEAVRSGRIDTVSLAEVKAQIESALR